MKNNWNVLAIPFSATHTWLKNKHYAKRIPSIVHAYGVFVDGIMQGVITYGIPASPSLTMGVCGYEYKHQVVELNRLAMLEDHDKNLASYFVSKTLKMLPKPLIVVSYADTSMGHVGYIYQATNFLYTGLSAQRTEWREVGVNTHSRSVVRNHSLAERIEDERFTMVERPRKHRYIYITGTKQERKTILSALNYPIKEYPKGNSSRYENEADVPLQMSMI